MATKNTNTLVHGILEEIGTTANALRSTFVTAGSENRQLDGNTFYLLGAIAEKIGWLADLGIEKITGSTDIVGDAEAWMLPPRYNDAKKAAELSHE